MKIFLLFDLYLYVVISRLYSAINCSIFLSWAVPLPLLYFVAHKVFLEIYYYLGLSDIKNQYHFYFDINMQWVSIKFSMDSFFLVFLCTPNKC